MIVVSGCLTKLFNGVGYFTIIGVGEPDRGSAGICFLRGKKTINEDVKKKSV